MAQKKPPKKGATRIGKGGGTLRWNGKKWVLVPGSKPTTPSGEPAPPPELPSLEASRQAMFSDLRQDAARIYEDALINYNEQTAGIRAAAERNLNELARQGYAGGQSLRQALSESGLGFSPMFLNKGIRDIASQVAGARSGVVEDRTARLAALDRMLSSAEQSRNLAISRIDRDIAFERAAGLTDLADQPLTPPGQAQTTPAAGGGQRPPQTNKPKVNKSKVVGSFSPNVPTFPTYGPWGSGPPPTRRQAPKSTIPTSGPWGVGLPPTVRRSVMGAR